MGSDINNHIRNEKDLLVWIKNNLGPIIRKAVADTPDDTNYFTEEVLGAIACRETGFLIIKFVNQGKTLAQVNELMRGDYGQRRNETAKQYHGFGYWQIDIGSFPDFIKSGDWKDPYKCCKESIMVLHKKALALGHEFNPDERTEFLHAIISAYNTGEGNEEKVIHAHKDLDATTFNHDYGKEVLRMKEIYKTLNGEQKC